jgi:type VI secretion system secreted protein Hcp
MAVDIIMQIGKIKGESNTHGETDWLAATSFSHGVAQDITTENMKENRKLGGTPHFSFLTVRRKVDVASPDILVHCINGTFIQNVEVRVYLSTKQDDTPLMTYKLGNCYIASTNSDGSDEKNEPMESVSIAYNQLELECKHLGTDNKLKKNYDLNLGV